jgi:exonuclease III
MDNFIVQTWNVGSADVDKQRKENHLDETVLNDLQNGIYLFQEISNKAKQYKNIIYQSNSNRNKDSTIELQPYGCAIYWTDKFKFVQVVEPRYFKPIYDKSKNEHINIGHRSTPFVVLLYDNMFIIVISIHCYVPKISSDNKRKLMIRSILDDSLTIRHKLEEKHKKKTIVIIGGDFNTRPQLYNSLFGNYIDKNKLHVVSSERQINKVLTTANQLTKFKERLDYLFVSNNINHSMESVIGISNQYIDNFNSDVKNKNMEYENKDHAKIQILMIPNMDPNII